MLRGLFLLLPLVVACGGASPQTVQLRDAVAAAHRAPGAAVAFRVPVRRGTPRLYQLPTLTPIETDLTGGPGADRLVGLSVDDGLLYVLAGGDLAALDLRIGRFRTLDSGVVRATIGQTGAVLLLHGDTLLASAAERRVARIGRPPAGTLEAFWPGPAGRTVVVVGGDSGRTLVVLAGDGIASRRPLPDGPLVRTLWGDAVAVLTPEGVVVTEVLRETPPTTIRLRDDVLALAFSGSGHRLYLATAIPEIVVLDRYEGAEIGRLQLPAPVSALRADPHGRYIFGASGGNVLVLDGPEYHVHTLPGSWDDDLPAAAADGTVLLRQADDVVALVPDDSTARAVVTDGGPDLWLVAPADLPVGAAAIVAATTPGGTDAGSATGEVYLQVSSTSNAQWAEGLAGDLRLAGMPAAVLPPSSADEMYRVVLGPFPTRDEAEATGRKLGMPYWIFQRDTTTAPGITP